MEKLEKGFVAQINQDGKTVTLSTDVRRMPAVVIIGHQPVEFFEIPKLQESYGDVKEIPNCLVKEIYDAMFSYMTHLHPNQKYRDHDGREKFKQACQAARVAINYIRK
jgi:hypothetical protein